MKNIILKKDTSRRKYCKGCKGYVTVITSYGDRIFCKVCNGLIKEK